MSTPPAARVPTIWCPFPSRISPAAAQVRDGTCGWLDRWELRTNEGQQRTSIADVALLAARYHPDLPYPVLQLVADWYTWFFYQDDLYHETNIGRTAEHMEALHGRLLTLLRGAAPTPDDPPLAHALCDLRDRWAQHASPLWMNHFAYHVSEFFAAMVWEATNLAYKTPPPLHTYLRVRPITGGFAIEQLIAEITDQLTFPHDAVAYTTWQRLRLLADHATCWLNDLVSLPKEMQQNDVHNLVLVLQHEQRLSLDDAVAQATAMHNNVIAAFMEQAANLPHCREHAQLQRYADVLQTRIRGNFDWMYAARRYQQPLLAQRSVECA